MSILLILCNLTSNADELYSFVGFEESNKESDWSENKFFQRFGEKFNIGFEITAYNDSFKYKEYIKSLNKDDLNFDAFFKSNLNNSELLELYSQGIIQDLSPYISLYMPNLNSILNDNSYLLDNITIDDKILSLPYINLLPPQNYIWINKDWLESLNMKIPSNAEEFLSFLSKVKTNDLNSNGKFDEISLKFNGIWDLKFLSHAFGIISDDFGLYNDNNKITYAYTSDRYFQFIDYLHKLFEEGLIDKSMFANKIDLKNEKLKNPLFGAIISPTPFAYNNIDFIKSYSILPALECDGNRIYRSFLPKCFPGAMAITSKCKNIPTLLSAIDYLYTEEGAKLISIGLENSEYTVFDDGTWDWINASSKNVENLINTTTMSSGSFAPYIEPNLFYSKYTNNSTANMINQITDFNEFLVDPIPTIHLNKSDKEYIKKYQDKLGLYVDERLVQFIIGERELNKDSWENYKDELENLGLNDFIEFWQNKYMEMKKQ